MEDLVMQQLLLKENFVAFCHHFGISASDLMDKFGISINTARKFLKEPSLKNKESLSCPEQAIIFYLLNEYNVSINDYMHMKQYLLDKDNLNKLAYYNSSIEKLCGDFVLYHINRSYFQGLNDIESYLHLSTGLLSITKNEYSIDNTLNCKLYLNTKLEDTPEPCSLDPLDLLNCYKGKLVFSDNLDTFEINLKEYDAISNIPLGNVYLSGFNNKSSSYYGGALKMHQYDATNQLFLDHNVILSKVHIFDRIPDLECKLFQLNNVQINSAVFYKFYNTINKLDPHDEYQKTKIKNTLQSILFNNRAVLSNKTLSYEQSNKIEKFIKFLVNA